MKPTPSSPPSEVDTDPPRRVIAHWDGAAWVRGWVPRAEEELGEGDGNDELTKSS